MQLGYSGSPEFIQLDTGSVLRQIQSERRNNLAHQKDEYTSDGNLRPLHDSDDELIWLKLHCFSLEMRANK